MPSRVYLEHVQIKAQ